MCIFYATLKIKKMKGDGTISVLSSDHYIENVKKLRENIKEAIELANNDESLVTIGIAPTYPATEFGYIKYDKNIACNLVIEFKEKPDYETAIKYVESNEYVWNSGMFIWKINSILKKFKEYLPSIYGFKEKLYNAINTNNEKEILKEVYKKVGTISIDKGILEKADNIEMIRGNFKWMDIGCIKDFFEIHTKDIQENVIIGEAIIKDTNKTNIFNNSEELLIVFGLENINIIKDNGVCIVCNKEKTNLVTPLLEDIKEQEKYKKYI